MSIFRKMVLLIALPTLLIYIVVLGLTITLLYERAREQVRKDMTARTADMAARFNDRLLTSAAIADATARIMEIVPQLTEEQVFAQLTRNVEADPLVYGACMAFEPGTFNQDDSLYAPYVYRGDDTIERMNITRDVYNWYADPAWTWYQTPKQLGHSLWTDPYFDEGAGNILMSTYSAPFYRDGRIRGVTTIDINLPHLRDTVGKDIAVDTTFVVLTSKGQFVYAPEESRIMDQTIHDVARETGRADLERLGDAMLMSEPGMMMIEGWETDERQWVFYAPITSPNWTFAYRLAESVVMDNVRRRTASMAMGLGVTLLLIVTCIFFMSRLITRPIARLNKTVLAIAKGDLDVRIDGIAGKDEIGQLGCSINKMTEDLKAHVQRLAEEQTARQKIEHDLDLAREIQRGLLPKSEPDLPGFEIAGWNQAADKTGGDYFDWLQLPDGRTIVTLADVTGHGIGPAMIVAVCRAYMRASTSSDSVDLSAALGLVNDLLHEDIPQGRFVTAAVGIIDPSRSRMELFSAGQAPMLFYEADTATVHSWEADDLPLGVTSDVAYPTPREITFRPGDMLVLTTDGFFEWPNHSNEQFGLERLDEVIRRHHDLPPQELIDTLYKAVLEHAEGTMQADDLTAVIIKKV